MIIADEYLTRGISLGEIPLDKWSLVIVYSENEENTSLPADGPAMLVALLEAFLTY